MVCLLPRLLFSQLPGLDGVPMNHGRLRTSPLSLPGVHFATYLFDEEVLVEVCSEVCDTGSGILLSKPTHVVVMKVSCCHVAV